MKKNNKIHITHIIPTLNFGGAERFVVDIVNNSDTKKFKYSIILLADAMPMAKEINNKNIEITVVKKRGKISLHLIKDIKKELQKIQPNIVHTHLSGGDIWGRIAAKKLGIKVVTTEHNVNNELGWVKNSIKRLIQNKTDVYVACSKAVKQDVLKRYDIQKKIEVIHYGIELERFKSIKPIRPKHPTKLLMLGRLTKQKGHEIALKALSGIDKKMWKLDIVGNGPLEKKLKNIVTKLDLQKNIKFYPPTYDVPGVFANHHIMLMPSLWEGLGIVVMEALISGRVVIGSNIGGIPELIKNNKTGYLVLPNNIELLKKQITFCLENINEIEKIGNQAREYAVQNFGIKIMVKKYENIYKFLVK